MNNAGAGLAHRVPEDVILNTNLYGPKRVCDSFIPLLSADGRVVNVGSGAGPNWLTTGFPFFFGNPFEMFAGPF